jgi:hypothetical protein
MTESAYQNLWQLMAGYFNEDSDLWGGNVQEIVACFKSESNEEFQKAVLDEIIRFENENTGFLDSAFEREFGHQFGPELWGYTTASFLEEVKGILDSK